MKSIISFFKNAAKQGMRIQAEPGNNFAAGQTLIFSQLDNPTSAYIVGGALAASVVLSSAREYIPNALSFLRNNQSSLAINGVALIAVAGLTAAKGYNTLSIADTLNWDTIRETILPATMAAGFGLGNILKAVEITKGWRLLQNSTSKAGQFISNCLRPEGFTALGAVATTAFSAAFYPIEATLASAALASSALILTAWADRKEICPQILPNIPSARLAFMVINGLSAIVSITNPVISIGNLLLGRGNWKIFETIRQGESPAQFTYNLAKKLAAKL